MKSGAMISGAHESPGSGRPRKTENVDNPAAFDSEAPEKLKVRTVIMPLRGALIQPASSCARKLERAPRVTARNLPLPQKTKSRLSAAELSENDALASMFEKYPQSWCAEGPRAALRSGDWPTHRLLRVLPLSATRARARTCTGWQTTCSTISVAWCLSGGCAATTRPCHSALAHACHTASLTHARYTGGREGGVAHLP